MKTYIVFKPETASRCLMSVAHFVRGECPGVIIKTHADIRLTPGQVLSLYGDDMPESVKQETVKRLAGFPLTVMQIADGESAVERIAQIRGSNVNPNECEPGTIRKMLAQQFELSCLPIQLDGGFLYWPNFVHVPQDRREALVCEGLFGRYFDG